MPSVCEVYCHVTVSSKVTGHLCLPGTFLVLALQVLSPEKPLSHKQPQDTIKSMCLLPLALKELIVSRGMRKQYI